MIINSVGSGGGGGEEYCIVHIINLSGINDSFTQFLHVFTRGMQVNLKHSNKKHKIEFTKVLDSQLCTPLCQRLLTISHRQEVTSSDASQSSNTYRYAV